MSTFRILPVGYEAELGWVVETTHQNGTVEISVIFASHAEAQAAAAAWEHLDEEWAAV